MGLRKVKKQAIFGKDIEMSGHIYLIKNKDLYKIGVTKDFKRRMKELKPDEIVKVLRIDSYKTLEKKLHRRYKDSRIPQTEYFRLNKSQLANCKQELTISYARRGKSEPFLIAVSAILISPIICFIWSFRQRSVHLGLLAFTQTLLSIYVYPSYNLNQSERFILKAGISFMAFIIAKSNKDEALK